MLGSAVLIPASDRIVMSNNKSSYNRASSLSFSWMGDNGWRLLGSKEVALDLFRSECLYQNNQTSKQFRVVVAVLEKLVKCFIIRGRWVLFSWGGSTPFFIGFLSIYLFMKYSKRLLSFWAGVRVFLYQASDLASIVASEYRHTARIPSISLVSISEITISATPPKSENFEKITTTEEQKRIHGSWINSWNLLSSSWTASRVSLSSLIWCLNCFSPLARFSELRRTSRVEICSFICNLYVNRPPPPPPSYPLRPPSLSSAFQEWPRAIYPFYDD